MTYTFGTTSKAFAPATVANVCCGFDILGFAMDFPGDEVRVTLRDTPIVAIQRIEGDSGRLPREANRNTAGVAILSFLQALGNPVGAEIELYKNLPLGSGMGSSAASGVAALVALNHLLGNPLTPMQLIPHAMEAERVACGSAHADNVAPSLLGGVVLVRDYHPLDIVPISFPTDLYCTLVHPRLELRTADSRRVLKPLVSLADAVTQSGNTAGLIVGLMKPDYALISRSLKDVIAEPVRAVFIPGFEQQRKAAIGHGALGCGISGSGPAIFILSTDDAVARRVGESSRDLFSQHGLASDVYVSRVSQEGARLVE
jgi:homoserine kinase